MILLFTNTNVHNAPIADVCILFMSPSNPAATWSQFLIWCIFFLGRTVLKLPIQFIHWFCHYCLQPGLHNCSVVNCEICSNHFGPFCLFFSHWYFASTTCQFSSVLFFHVILGIDSIFILFLFIFLSSVCCTRSLEVEKIEKKVSHRLEQETKSIPSTDYCLRVGLSSSSFFLLLFYPPFEQFQHGSSWSMDCNVLFVIAVKSVFVFFELCNTGTGVQP